MGDRAEAVGGAALSMPAIRRLDSYDRHCLRVETPARPLQVGLLAILDGGAMLDAQGRPRLADLRREIDGRLALVPQLRWVIHDPGLLAGPPVWVDDPDFRIDRHVRLADVEPPGDDAALLAVTERLMAPLLDRAHPLWQLWLLTGLPDGRMGALIVVHHALADGLTAMRMVRTLLEGPVGSRGDALAAAPANPPPSWPMLVADNLRSKVRSLLGVLRPSTWRFLVRATRYVAWVGLLSRATTPSSLNAPVGPRRRLWALRLDLPAVKRIARANGCGANDVVLALVAGGVGALLRSRGEPVERLRPRAGVAVALFTTGHEGKAGNDIGTLHVHLPVAEPDTTRRLPLVAAETATARLSPMVALEPVIRARVSSLAGRRTMERQRLVNLSQTYLPGPHRSIEVLGCRVLELLPVAPLAGNLGLSFVALSYAGTLTLAVRADADRFPDLDTLTAALEADWRALHQDHREGEP